MTDNKDMPAFPQSCSANENGIYLATSANVKDNAQVIGFTKREEIAARAMAALIGNWEASCKICDSDPRYDGTNFKEVVAINSAEFADALLFELSKP